MSNVLFQATTLATPPVGTAVAVDPIAGEQHQLIKVEFGAAGVATPVSSANPLPVDTELTTADLDTGAGTDTRAVVGLVFAASGGATPVSASAGLPVNVVGGSAANAAAGATGAAVPASADYVGINVGGTLRGATGASRGSEFAQSIQVVDASGNQITSFGGTAGVVTGYHRITTADTNAVNIQASSTKLRALHVYNNADYPIHVCFHNTAGTPTAGAAVVRKYGIPGGGLARDIIIQGGGLQFATGLGMTVVKGAAGTAIADTDNTAVAAGDAAIEVEYE